MPEFRQRCKKVVIAYEPIWAIGTGKTATDDQAEEVCGGIRKLLQTFTMKKYRKRDYYSVRRHERKELCGLLSKPNIDGGLIGGASLKSADFAVITSAAK